MTGRQKYNLTWGPEFSDLNIELWCFRENHPTDRGGLGAYSHFKRAAKILFPRLEWNPWLASQIRSLCDVSLGRINQITREIVWAGCASAGKTFAAALFAYIFWLAQPDQSVALLTSTTSKMIRKRMWPVIQQLHTLVLESMRSQPGNMVDSQTTLQAVKGDDKHAIFAKAVGQGETVKAAADIQGIHARRILVVLDEATEVRDAILTAVENLEKGCENLVVLKIGNAVSRFDPLGLAMEPKNGWQSVTVDSEEWDTARGGLCLHFDGFKSPNVIAGVTKHRHIYTYENYLADLKKDQNTIEFWMYTRGFPAPDSVSNVVLSEALILQHDGMGRHTFAQSKIPIAALDPAFGGDDCILTFADMGLIAGDAAEKIGIQITETLPILIDARSSEARDYQIARQVIDQSKARGVTKDHFATDSTGTGRGLAAIIDELWI